MGLLEVACAHRHVRHLRAHESTFSAFHFSDFDHYEKFTKSWSFGICKKKILHLNIFLQLGISTKIILSLGLVNFEILTCVGKREFEISG